jgi:hypothetical protein
MSSSLSENISVEEFRSQFALVREAFGSEDCKRIVTGARAGIDVFMRRADSKISPVWTGDDMPRQCLIPPDVADVIKSLHVAVRDMMARHPLEWPTKNIAFRVKIPSETNSNIPRRADHAWLIEKVDSIPFCESTIDYLRRGEYLAVINLEVAYATSPDLWDD